MKWLRRLFYLIVILAVIAVPAYYWLIMESHMPSSGSYSIDMAEVRRLADSMPGDKPQEIRVETIAHLSFPRTAIMAGDTWENDDMPVSSYQLVYPDHTAIIDTALAKDAGGKDSSFKFTSFDDAAYKRMSDALPAASFIVITHEHVDHIGGIIAHPDLAKVLAVTRLTKEQVDNPDRMQPLKWPEGALNGYKPIEYDRYDAIAPGVVLIKAPGHTPGSQLVYVKRADGKELLFLGDVAWKRRNITELRERARLVTWLFLKEDRDQVMLELAEFQRLTKDEPNVDMMPGHDQDALDHFESAGFLVKGFK